MTVTSDSPEATGQLGGRIGAACRGGEVILLTGPLGAGKTRLAKGIAEGLGIDPATVTSPTFTLMQIHHGRLPLYHVDLYRIEQPDEAAHQGLFDEVEGPGVTVIEWPDRGGSHTPAQAVSIDIKPEEGEQRTITVSLPEDGYGHFIGALS